ncbi:hypothetical protein [Azospirillum sp. ST 5-10]|uniref:hypothetical protein n=1 Tax=unclassified Azospirillum TaxID=2630922 RepID=UPI003F4A7BEE
MARATVFKKGSARMGAAGLAALALAACDGSRVVGDEPDSAYNFGELAYAAADRDLRVVVQGNPFAATPAELAQTVTTVMGKRIAGIRTNPTVQPDSSARPDYRVVVVFEPVQPTLNARLCAMGPVPTRPTGETLTVQAAFCREGRTLTSATGWLDEPQGPNDPRLRHLVGDITSALFPTPGAGGRS